MATLTIQPDATAGMDAMLSGPHAGATNFGDTDPIYVGTHVSGKSVDSARAILSLNVSGVPANVTIENAVLTLKSTLGVGLSNATFHAVRVRHTDWAESAVTWTQYKSSLNWTTAGAKDTTNDQDTTGQDSCTISGTADLVFSGLAALVRDAIANRSGILHLLIIGPEGGGSESSAQIKTSDNATPANRPALVITYTSIFARRSSCRRAASRGAA